MMGETRILELVKHSVMAKRQGMVGTLVGKVTPEQSYKGIPMSAIVPDLKETIWISMTHWNRKTHVARQIGQL